VYVVNKNLWALAAVRLMLAAPLVDLKALSAPGTDRRHCTG